MKNLIPRLPPHIYGLHLFNVPSCGPGVHLVRLRVVGTNENKIVFSFGPLRVVLGQYIQIYLREMKTNNTVSNNVFRGSHPKG
jgi:hypothetical protein